ncbi:LUD domain-containing protein [Beijerinckia sp. L45]|uniref:LutC/YkgG family protein n=1 Tax=Beijerinckia sp. L45 TaxID=1641855 RepID=UPI00131C5A59|nr:LUD domain-containing protein [Beijerinckia sp. L45]
MSSRDDILGAIRRDRPAPLPLPDVPMFDEGRADDLLGRFTAAFTMMGGKMLDLPADGDPLAEIRARVAKAGVVISMVPEVAGNTVLDPELMPSKLENVDIAIVRAAFGVAETGSICLTERELGVNTLGYLAQHLIVLLDPADLVVNIHHAYHRPEIHAARYCVFHTGPSATADIEGVLILGAQGVRSLSILSLPRA